MLAEFCKEHSGHTVQLDNLEKVNVEQWKAIKSAHKRMDGMQNWVIAGMTSVVLQLLLMISGLIFAYLKLGSAS